MLNLLRRFWSHQIRRRYWTLRARRQVGSVAGILSAHHASRLTRNTHLGQRVNFNGVRIKGKGRVVIGDYFHSGEDLLILTESHNHDGDALPYDNSYILRDVRIGNYVWIGDRVTILPGATIDDGAIIQAGSTVVGDVPALAIAGGHPARPFGWRNREKYDRLKREGKFK